MTNAQARVKALQVLRKRVRFKTAHLTLPGGDFTQDDTQLIREATESFVETWVVPLIDYLEAEDYTEIKRFYELEQGDTEPSAYTRLQQPTEEK